MIDVTQLKCMKWLRKVVHVGQHIHLLDMYALMNIIRHLGENIF